MEVREAAACGISLREFVIEFETDELADIYRVFHYAQTGVGFCEEDFLEDLKSQMTYIIGTSVEEEPPEIEEETIHWEDTGVAFELAFNEPEASKLYAIFNGVETPGEGFDKEMNQKLMSQMMEMAPSILENLPIINR